MAFPTNGTKLANLFNPEVVAGLIEAKLTNAIKFSPLCKIDTTLEGRPGSELTFASYKYIGDAEDVAEGADIPVAKLEEGTTKATVKKAGKGVQLSDEAVLSGYGDPAGEAVDQILKSIASKVDNDTLAVLNAIDGTMVANTGVTADGIADALVKFGEDIDGEKVLLVSPAAYNTLRKANEWCPASEIAANLIIKGAVGMIHGCQVVVTNKLTDTAFIVKPGALMLIVKRDTLVETDRDIINKSTVLTADKHYVVYLYDASKAIKVTAAA